MDQQLKVGIIGAGRIGKVHSMSIINYLPQVELAAISDVNIKEAEDWAKRAGIPKVYENYTEIIQDPTIDAILICSSTDTHAQIAMEAAKAGKHIFCEKPVDLTIEKVKATIHAAKEAGVKLQVGFNRRFDHNFQKVQQLIKAGELGDLHIIKITSRDPAPPSPEYCAVSGGIFLDMTIHDFDMARFMMGCEPVEIYTRATCLVDEQIGKSGDFDTALLTITFENGAICSIDNSRKAVYGYDQRIEVFGSRGKVEIGNDTPSTAIWSTEAGVCSEKPKYFFLERYMDSFAEEMKRFIEAILQNKETLVTGNDGLQPLRMGLAAKKSVLENRPVKMSEIDDVSL